MELTGKQKKIVLNLISVAWQAGAVRSQEQSDDLKELKAMMLSLEQQQDKKVE
jgi:hypothetical protein